jgi:hypothetical protein
VASDPTTPAEWEEAVNLAHVYLLIDSAQKYGLLDGGPKVDVGRCEEILHRGQDRGVVPRADAVEWWMKNYTTRER